MTSNTLHFSSAKCGEQIHELQFLFVVLINQDRFPGLFFPLEYSFRNRIAVRTSLCL
jgi:hypothetical protein